MVELAQSGWGFCMNWCPEPAGLRCWSILAMRRRQSVMCGSGGSRLRTMGLQIEFSTVSNQSRHQRGCSRALCKSDPKDC